MRRKSSKRGSKFRQYAEETTIHGISELLRYKSWSFRVTWVICISLMVLLLGVEIYKQVALYCSKPRATKIDQVHTRTFPSVALCSTDWIDQRKAAALGLANTKDQMIALGNLCFSVQRPSNFYANRGNFEEVLEMVNSMKPWDKTAFESAFERAGSYAELFTQLGFDYEDVGDVMCTSCKARNVSVRTMVREVGPCWVFEPGEVREPTNRVFRIPTLELAIKFPPDSTMNGNTTFTVLVGAHAEGILGPETASVVPYRTNIVDVSMVRKVKLHDCNATKGHSTSVCDVKTYAFLSEACNINCMPYAGDLRELNMTNDEPYCNWLLQPKLFENKCWEELPNVPSTCLEPCNQTIVTAATSQLPVYDDKDLHVKVRLTNMFEMMAYVEYDSYPLAAMVSDLGGLLGLFLGASAISVAHTVYFCCILPFTSIPRTDTDTESDQESKKRDKKGTDHY